ncbi:MAG: ANTAR domain-containing response regulator [Thermodesulfobacteriota bacterium]
MGNKEPEEKTDQEACETLNGLKSRIKKLTMDLEARKKIEKAKWILVKAKGIDEDEAQRILINQSRANRKKLVDMAETIITGERLLNGKKKDG